ncbi:MAG: FAD binding domain-containing protein [Actinomycetota bacterium]
MAHGPAVLIPTSPAEAVEMFGDGDGTLVVGGGTIVVPSIRLGYERPATALMLHRAGLGGVSRDGGRVTIGAGTTLAELAGLPDPIASCVAHIADGEGRGQATVGGNLCAANFEAPRGDLQGVLIALGAHVRSAGKGGERTEPVEDLLASRAGRLVLDVAYDEAPGVYVHLDRQHTHEYTALAVTAVRGADGVRLAATGAGPHGLRLPSAEAHADDPAAAGQAALADVQLADDAVASAWYREQTLPILVRRALERLKEAA